MLSLNNKHVQHVKINLACNFEVNLITHLEVIALFSSNSFGSGELKNDEKRAITPRRVSDLLQNCRACRS
jgi:hypothetical protein